MNTPDYRTLRLGTNNSAAVAIISRYGYFVFFAVVMISGCDAPELPKIVTISKAPVFRPSSPQEIHTLEEAMATIITTCREHLALPVVDPLRVHLYKNTKSFGILFGRQNRMDVEEVTASAQGSDIHVNLEALEARPWREEVQLLAHEYAHGVHYTLAGRGDRISWLVEGFAEWVAAKVLHALKWEDYSVALHRTEQELIRHKTSLPALSSLRENKGWASERRKPKGFIRTYSLAFAAVDLIITEKGLSRAVNYFRSGNFGASFGESQETFENRFQRSLPVTYSSNTTAFSFPKPDWQLGFEWTYTEKGPGKSSTIIKHVIRKDTFKGETAFVAKVDDDEYFLTAKTLSLVAIQRNGTPILVQTKSNRFIDWPLEGPKEWRNAYTRENLEEKSNDSVDHLMVVSGIHTIQVPAGTFETIKVQGYDYKSGRLLMEHWYSPKVKWFVKSRNYRRKGLVEEELMRFKVDEASVS